MCGSRDVTWNSQLSFCRPYFAVESVVEGVRTLGISFGWHQATPGRSCRHGCLSVLLCAMLLNISQFAVRRSLMYCRPACECSQVFATLWGIRNLCGGCDATRLTPGVIDIDPHKILTIYQWRCPRDHGLGLEAPRGQKWKFWSWIMKSWSWRKSLADFQDFCCNSWRQWARHTMAFCERQQKQLAIPKPLFEITCAPCTLASVERVFF